jgi:hypothetical protein
MTKNKNFDAPHDVMFHTPLLFDSCAGAKFPDIVMKILFIRMLRMGPQLASLFMIIVQEN